MPTDYGKETVTVLEIDMPFCQKEYGTTNAAGTCNASLTPIGSPPLATGDHKCFNTRVTCQDPLNYLPATQVIRFSYPQRGLTKHYDNIFPAMLSVETTAGTINLGAMDRNVSALGVREAVDIELDDFRWNDHLLDKYRLERISGAAQAPTGSPPVSETYDPYERGTFWGKFLARNPYYVNYRARILRGFMGDALSDLTSRSYIVDRITGPTNSKVRITLKDLFSLIEAKKSMAPVASLGELSVAITESDTTATLLPTGIGSLTPAEGGYSTITTSVPGYVAIGDEVMLATRSGDVLTFLTGSPSISTRGSLGTTPSTHDAEDLVQLALEFPSDQAHEHIYSLLTGYSEILASEIPKAEWDILAQSMPELYSTIITEPTPVNELIGELCEQSGCTVWHDPGTGLIEFMPLRPRAASVTVNDRDWIVANSLELKRQDTKRVSRVLVYYSQRNPTIDLEEKTNFRSLVISPDLDAEDSTQYGVEAIKEIFSRWIPQFGSSQAGETGSRILALFRNPPLEASFRLHSSRDGALLLAEPFNLQAFETQNDTGAETPELMAPIRIARSENHLDIKAQGAKFFTAPSDAGTRTIFLDSADMRNLNLRTVHDSIYASPTGSEVVEFILPSGFIVGSTSTSTSAIETGSWIDGVTLNFTNSGLVQGRGGNGGNGGVLPAIDGLDGGNAFEATYPITIDNTNGQIWAGGGGGGGGIRVLNNTPSGGGGGAGTNPGNGGLGNNGGSNGSNGTSEAGGDGGTTIPSGGNGGGPGLVGDNAVSGGSGGAPGNYIVGNSFVTWAGNGDRRGGVA